MRIVRNVGHIKRRKRAAKWTAILGFLLLMGPFLLLSQPNFVFVAWAMMIGGFVAFNSGMQQVGKWSRNPRNDVLLDKRLAKLSDKFEIFHYVPLGKRVADHVILHPGGLLVLTTRELPGEITGVGSRWRTRSSPLRRLFGFSGPQLGNPSRDTQETLAALESVLSDAALNVDVDVDGAVVFVHPLVKLDADDTDYPALLVQEVAGYVQAIPPDPRLLPAHRETIRRLLASGEGIETPVASPARRPVKRRRAA